MFDHTIVPRVREQETTKQIYIVCLLTSKKAKKNDRNRSYCDTLKGFAFHRKLVKAIAALQ
jgi:hypothetical protein